MADFDQAVFWPAFKASGISIPVDVLLPDAVRVKDVDVLWHQPTFDGLGQRSNQYEMEYQHADLPTLRESCQVVKGGELYRVREAPFVTDGDGFFRRVLLTKEANC